MLTKKLMVCIIKFSVSEVRIVMVHISVDQLINKPGEQQHFSFTGPTAPLDLTWEGIEFPEPFSLWLTATYNNGKVLLKGILRTKVIFECSRCLQSFSCPFEGDFEEEIEVEDKETLEVAELVREVIFAGLPLKPLCHISCAGLCAACGVNLNQQQCDCRFEHVDHRMLALKKLLEQDK
jgi:uncharacterized protein